MKKKFTTFNINRLSIICGVIGIFFYPFFFGLAAIITGALSREKDKEAMIGIIMGSIEIILVLIYASFIYSLPPILYR